MISSHINLKINQVEIIMGINYKDFYRVIADLEKAQPSPVAVRLHQLAVKFTQLNCSPYNELTIENGMAIIDCFIDLDLTNPMLTDTLINLVTAIKPNPSYTPKSIEYKLIFFSLAALSKAKLVNAKTWPLLTTKEGIDLINFLKAANRLTPDQIQLYETQRNINQIKRNLLEQCANSLSGQRRAQFEQLPYEERYYYMLFVNNLERHNLQNDDELITQYLAIPLEQRISFTKEFCFFFNLHDARQILNHLNNSNITQIITSFVCLSNFQQLTPQMKALIFNNPKKMAQVINSLLIRGSTAQPWLTAPIIEALLYLNEKHNATNDEQMLVKRASNPMTMAQSLVQLKKYVQEDTKLAAMTSTKPVQYVNCFSHVGLILQRHQVYDQVNNTQGYTEYQIEVLYDLVLLLAMMDTRLINPLLLNLFLQSKQPGVLLFVLQLLSTLNFLNTNNFLLAVQAILTEQFCQELLTQMGNGYNFLVRFRHHCDNETNSNSVQIPSFAMDINSTAKSTPSPRVDVTLLPMIFSSLRKSYQGDDRSTTSTLLATLRAEDIDEENPKLENFHTAIPLFSPIGFRMEQVGVYHLHFEASQYKNSFPIKRYISLLASTSPSLLTAENLSKYLARPDKAQFTLAAEILNYYSLLTQRNIHRLEIYLSRSLLLLLMELAFYGNLSGVVLEHLFKPELDYDVCAESLEQLQQDPTVTDPIRCWIDNLTKRYTQQQYGAFWQSKIEKENEGWVATQHEDPQCWVMTKPT